MGRSQEKGEVVTPTTIHLDAFTRAYVECALWSSNDESTPAGGDPMDMNYSITDIAPEALEKMKADCAKFQADHAADIEQGIAGPDYTATERAGHDFWLTRHHHGAGFWDGDWPEAVGERLTVACHRFMEAELYVGDDGLIYC